MIEHMRVVLDTNVLIDGFNDDYNAASKLIDGAIDEEITALCTSPIVREYRRILYRLITDVHLRERAIEFIDSTVIVKPASVEVVLDDEEDRKFLEAAVGGSADLLITNDHHLLDIGEIEGVRIVRPTEALAAVEAAAGGSGEWQQWVKGLGLG